MLVTLCTKPHVHGHTFTRTGTDYGEASFKPWVEWQALIGQTGEDYEYGVNKEDCVKMPAWRKEHNEASSNKDLYTSIAEDLKKQKCTSDRDKNKEDLRTVCPSDYNGATYPMFLKYKMAFPAANVYRRICHLNDGAHPKQTSLRNRATSEIIMLAKNMIYTNKGAKDAGTYNQWGMRDWSVCIYLMQKLHR